METIWADSMRGDAIDSVIDASPLLDDADTVYSYDGSLEGFLSVVFEGFHHHAMPADITAAGPFQSGLLTVLLPIETNTELANRVRIGIIKKMGSEIYHKVKWAFLSDAPGKEMVIYLYLRHIFAQGPAAADCIGCAPVSDFEKLFLSVCNERQHMLQFLRFSRAREGLFFAHINPKANVVPILMEHFVARYNVQPFIIYDEVHLLAGVYDTKDWWLVDARDFRAPDCSDDRYGDLWQTFYDHIAIAERRNPALRRSFMPQRLWRNICEVSSETH